MFSAYTPIEKCIGKEIKVHFGGQEYVGMLAGIYTSHHTAILVLTPISGAGTEQHIPMANAVVTVQQG